MNGLDQGGVFRNLLDLAFPGKNGRNPEYISACSEPIFNQTPDYFLGDF
jgi:hypothetical protein